ncbi:MAG: hypothetical protein U9N00_03495 [Candidatus Bipolaricaulota bacterium]|nr:hypothetical protein [Candidatus Bipolaricaulota bacterium]
MKGLMTVFSIAAVLLCSVAVSAGPLEFHIGVGPSLTFLGEINNDIEFINRILIELNGLATVDGEVPLLEDLGRGISYQAGERFWLTERFALGWKIGYSSTATTTSGTYTAIDGSESSTIDISLDGYSVGFVLGGRYTFLDAGILLSANIGAGVYYTGLDKAITFAIPSSYGPLSDRPEEGEGRYAGSALGVELGLNLSLPITDWFEVGALVFYRATTPAEMTDNNGNSLDIDGDGIVEGVSLGGITVQATFSLDINLSL